MLFTLSDLEAQLSESIGDGLELFFKQGRLTQPNIQRGGALVTQLIPQPAGAPLRVYVRIIQGSEGVKILGECTCSERNNCKHVALTLLQVLHQWDALPELDSGDLGYVADEVSGNNAISNSVHRPSEQALIYIIHNSDEGMRVETRMGRQLAQGGYALNRYFKPSPRILHSPPRFLQSEDLKILKFLLSLVYDEVQTGFVLKGLRWSQILEAMLATGRCYYEKVECSTPLRLGESRAIEWQWRVDNHGRQHAQLLTTPAADTYLPQSPPWYLDSRKGESGPLDTDLPHDLLRRLYSMAPISPDDVETISIELRNDYPDIPIPPLQQFETVDVKRVKPTPCLCLSSLEFEAPKGGKKRVNLASLSFDYAGIVISRRLPAYRFKEGCLIRVKRDLTMERVALASLCEAGLAEEEDLSALSGEDCFLPVYELGTDEANFWLGFQADALPRLKATGWRIEFDRFRYHFTWAEGWICNPVKLDRQDWFSLSLGVTAEGQRIELLPILLQYLRALPDGLSMTEIGDEPLIIPYKDQQSEERLLALTAQQIKPLLHILLEMYGNKALSNDKSVHLSRIQLARLSALRPESDGFYLEWVADADVQSLMHCLGNVDRISAVQPPSGLNAQLRPYQQRGLDWLQFLREYRLAGILADDMGLGKTLQAIAHLLLEKESGRADQPSLVVVPTSLMFNWHHEIQRFAPQLKMLLLHGPGRKSKFRYLDEYDLIITTYTLLMRDREVLVRQSYHVLILDEAQAIKNTKTQVRRVAKAIDVRHRLCLTGTPLENNLGELWSLFDFVLPGLLGDAKQFSRFFRTPIEKQGDSLVAQRLSRRIQPFLLRRTKERVARDLPKKSEIIHSVMLEGKQREIYETVRVAMHRRVREEIARQGLERSRIIVLDALLKLRQVCCDPRLVKLDEAQKINQSAKLSALMAMIHEMVEEGRRILLFSQFTGMLALIEEEIKKVRIDYVKLTGRTKDREGPVNRFQQGTAPLFLISLKAGGVGLNLTAADTIIHYDPWWNPAVERQATDRAHRIGQQQAVFVYKLICEGTVEEKILAMQNRKQSLVDSLFQAGGNQEPQWSEQDLETLFESLQE
jgi:superfamily II DNA or RNA helicase